MKIGIIGGGFSGTMTAIHLIENTSEAIELIIINEKKTFNKGIAYYPYSQIQLLNVATCKMSAFVDRPEHFIDWVMKQEAYCKEDKERIANSYLPRILYGQYLSAIWKECIESAKAKKHTINIINDVVNDLEIVGNEISLSISTGEKVIVQKCVIASGNHIPRNPKIKNIAFYSSKNYFQNPWDLNAVSNTNSAKPILIIGNGLTMVDTVSGLIENGFENKIYSISQNGFNILPHQHDGIKYTKLVDELSENASLKDIVKLFNKHLKLIRILGLSAEPLIDSMRPYTQKIWQRLTVAEKRLFMARLRHLWGVARHRIPFSTHEKIQQYRIDKKLSIYAGNIIDLKEVNSEIQVEFYNKKRRVNETIIVSRVINCTGPETDLLQLENHYLKNCLTKGIVVQDALKLGINADVNTFQVIDKTGKKHEHLFTLGSNLKGMLWESTAVNELRTQASQLAKGLTSKTLIS